MSAVDDRCAHELKSCVDENAHIVGCGRVELAANFFFVVYHYEWPRILVRCQIPDHEITIVACSVMKRAWHGDRQAF